jgi:hypothetical protein
MDGLGTAMAINHGVMQHFMGAMFSHQTCLPLVHRKKDDKVSASNCNNNFLIVGWGSNGGAAEVSESKRKGKKKTSLGIKRRLKRRLRVEAFQGTSAPTSMRCDSTVLANSCYLFSTVKCTLI